MKDEDISEKALDKKLGKKLHKKTEGSEYKNRLVLFVIYSK